MPTRRSLWLTAESSMRKLAAFVSYSVPLTQTLPKPVIVPKARALAVALPPLPVAGG